MFLAIDIGGTNIKCGILKNKDEILDSFSLKSQSFKNPEEIFLQIKERIKNKYLVDEIGLCAPDLDAKNGIMQSPPNIHWDHYDLKISLSNIFDTKKIYFLKDSDAFLMSEYFWGKAQGHQDILAFTLGTGLGSSVITEGRLIKGGNQLGVEAGHIEIIAEGRACSCGIKGHAEAYLSDKGFLQNYKDLGGKENFSNAYELIEASGSDDLSHKALEQSAYYLSILLSNLYNIFSPSLIVFGGGNASFIDLCEERIRKEMSLKIFSPIKKDFILCKSGFTALESSLLSAYATKFYKKV